eukprot:GCRY01003746.1.p2 GENE.GCRY01003746.1~~GCRY01003746.1.p2  ORF type:complete len:127 (+),score=17.03 GCRY01003746.1:293-673(+)
MMAEKERKQGMVKWFSYSKGYGYITVFLSHQDIFVHFSAIRGTGYRILEEDNIVDFVVQATKKGNEARDVVVFREEKQRQHFSNQIEEVKQHWALNGKKPDPIIPTQSSCQESNQEKGDNPAEIPF